MPQLEPGPWFKYLVFAWLIFLHFMPDKLLKYVDPNQRPIKNEKPHKLSRSYGNWPW
uniref:ATP synthase complex subunit 8 n=1 Tax=Nocomis micropogon TaxID=181614 RepID=A0A4D6DHU5_9TELE|nr:ATP synthase F0 subunit 8 [Nocomis micropogon]QBZ37639.1 ATP synthase F0 subunit 8 [Nocomis micropogon]QWE36660.1 ATP synthase F0 subunit 8 [Nocomis micropogon]